MANETQALSPKEFQKGETVDATTVNRAVLEINLKLRGQNPDLTNGGTVTIDGEHLPHYVETNKLTRRAIDDRFQRAGWTIRYREENERTPGGKRLRQVILVAQAAPVQRGV